MIASRKSSRRPVGHVSRLHERRQHAEDMHHVALRQAARIWHTVVDFLAAIVLLTFMSCLSLISCTTSRKATTTTTDTQHVNVSTVAAADVLDEWLCVSSPAFHSVVLGLGNNGFNQASAEACEEAKRQAGPCSPSAEPAALLLRHRVTSTSAQLADTATHTYINQHLQRGVPAVPLPRSWLIPVVVGIIVSATVMLYLYKSS